MPPARKAKPDMLSLFDKEGGKTYISEQLEAIYAKGNYGAFNLFSNKNDVPLGLSSRMVWELVHGKKKKSIRSDYFDYLVREFISLHDESNFGSDISVPQKPHESEGDETFIWLLDDAGNHTDYFKEIKEHHQRTGVAAYALLGSRTDMPNGLTKDIVRSWLKGKTRKAKLIYVEYVLSRWREIPDKEDKIFVQLLDEKGNPTDYLKEIKEHHERTGVGVRALLRDQEVIPIGLTISVMDGWIDGKTKNAQLLHVDYALFLWRQLPDAQQKVQITPALKEKLANMLHEGNTSPRLLIKYAGRANVPDGLTHYAIENWLTEEERQVPKIHFDFVICQLEKLHEGRSDYIVISDEIRSKLNAEKERTFLTPKALLRGQQDLPERFMKDMVAEWLSGAVTTAEKSHISYVLKKWEEMPDRTSYSAYNKSSISHECMPRKTRSPRVMVNITEEDRETLRSGFEKSGIDIKAFLRRFSPALDELSASTLSNWMSGKALTARKSHFDYVITSLRKLSDSFPEVETQILATKNPPHREERVVIKKHQIEELKIHQERTAIGGVVLLRNLQDVPIGLTGNMISRWINGYVYTALPDHIEYVLKSWRGIPDAKK